MEPFLVLGETFFLMERVFLAFVAPAFLGNAFFAETIFFGLVIAFFCAAFGLTSFTVFLTTV
jgi:hypothetical protein